MIKNFFLKEIYVKERGLLKVFGRRVGISIMLIIKSVVFSEKDMFNIFEVRREDGIFFLC